MIDLDFMKRAKELALPFAYESICNRRNYQVKWREKNLEKWKTYLKKYLNSEKGKKSRFKSSKNRNERIKFLKSQNSKEERSLVYQFYKNTPENMTVDHIIPVSRGGSHKVCNLQYISIKENRKKASKVLTECQYSFWLNKNI